MKRQRLFFCRCAAVVEQVVVDKETHLRLSMTAIDGGEGQLWVKVRNTHSEWMSSASPPNSDIAQRGRHFPFVPTAEVVERDWEGSQGAPCATFAYVTLSSHDRPRRSEPPEGISAAIHAGDTAGDLYARRFRTPETIFRQHRSD
jgi:hypothetical protein